MSNTTDPPDDSAEPPAELPASVACVRCLTGLSGVRLDGACPKCGLSSVMSLPPPMQKLIAKKEGHRRAPDGLLCQRCRHSLGGLTLKEHCPQCKLTVEQSIAGSGWQSALDEHGAILTDLECVRCGYNLRSLQEDGICPECGLSVESSTRGHFLCRGEPNWVRGIAIGCSIVYLSTALAALAAIANFLMSRRPFPTSMAAGFFFLFIPGAMLLGCVGLWIITGREHGWYVSDRNRRARRWARIGMTSAICLPIAAVSSALLGPPGGGFSIFHWLVLLMVICGGSLIGLPSYFKYVRSLCLRIPDRRLAERAEQLKTAIAPSLVTLFIIVLALFAIGVTRGLGSSFVPVIDAIAIIAGIATLAFLCAACAFHFRLSRLLHGEANAARNNVDQSDTAKSATTGTAPLLGETGGRRK